MATPIAVNVVYNYNFNQHMLMNPVIHMGLQTALASTKPNISGVEGQMCYTSDTNTLWYHNGTDNGTGDVPYGGWVPLGSAGAGIQGVNAGTHINVTGTSTVVVHHETVTEHIAESGPGSPWGITGLNVLQDLTLSDNDTGHVEDYETIDLSNLLDNYLKWIIKGSEGDLEVTTHRQVDFKPIDNSLSVSYNVLGTTTNPNAVDPDMEVELSHTTSFSGYVQANNTNNHIIHSMSVNSEGHVTDYQYDTVANMGLTTEAFRVFGIGTIASIGSNVNNVVADNSADTLTFKTAPATLKTQIGIELKTDPTTDSIHIAHASTTGLPNGGQTVPAGEVINGVSIDDYGHIIGFSTIHVQQNFDTNLGNTNLVQTANERTYEMTDGQTNALKFNVDVSGTKRPMLHFDTQAYKVYIGDGQLNPDLVVYGDLTVFGNTTTLDTQTVTIEDNIIRLNSNATTPAADGGIEVYRGGGANQTMQFIWNEASKYWSTVDQEFHVGQSDIIASGDVDHFWVEKDTAPGVLHRVTPGNARASMGAGTLSKWIIETDQGGSKTTNDIDDDNDKLTIKAGTNITVSMATSATNPIITINVPNASTSVKGAVELATNSEARQGTATLLALTASNLGAMTAKATFTGNGSDTKLTIEHNWNTPYVMVEVIEDDVAQNYATIECGVAREDAAGAASLDHVTLLFGHPPTSGKTYTAMLWHVKAAAAADANSTQH